jgi:chemotaxis protein MotB
MRLFPLLVVLGGVSCMTTSAHKAQMDELQRLREIDQKTSDEKVAKLEKAAVDVDAQHKAELSSLNAALLQTQADFTKAAKSVDDSQALVGELRTRLERMGQNADKLTGERGQLAQALEEARSRLDELRRQKAAAEARAAMFRGLVDKLRSMIDSGQLSVVVRNGKMLIVLPNDVLFDSGRTNIKPAGKAALTAVATALTTIKGRTFLVAGHTDDVPIHTKEFPSNWELSTARAVQVTNLFIENGVAPVSLAAAGYGEFDPVAPNDSPENKALNRRIEIELLPNLSELPSLEHVLDTK